MTDAHDAGASFVAGDVVRLISGGPFSMPGARMNLAADAAAFLARRRAGCVSRRAGLIVERREIGARSAKSPPAKILARPVEPAPPSLADDIAAIIKGGGFPKRLM